MGIFENSDGSFVGINDKHTANFFICENVGYQWGYQMFFTKIDAEGNLVNHFEINPGCENNLGSVAKVDTDKYAVAATFYNAPPNWSGTPPDSHLFFMDGDGNITNEKIYPNVSFEKASIFLGNPNEINLIYINENRDIDMNIYNYSLDLISSSVYLDTNNSLPTSIIKIDAHQQALSNNISIAISYRNYPDYRLKILTFDADFNLIHNYDYPWVKFASNRLHYANDNFIIASTTEDSAGNTDIRLQLFAPNGVPIDSTITDLIFDSERVTGLAVDDNNQIVIAGSFNCCNLDEAIGASKSFLSFEHGFVTGIDEQEFSDDIQIFPNPTTGNLHIKSDISKIVRIDIYDQLGSVIFSKTKSNEIKDINISDIPTGMYFIALSDEYGRNAVKKIIFE